LKAFSGKVQKKGFFQSKACDYEQIVISCVNTNAQTNIMESKVKKFWIPVFLIICISSYRCHASSGQQVEQNSTSYPISIEYQNNAFTEFYIPEGKTLPISCGKQAEGKSLIIIHPFFQDIVSVKHPQKGTVFPSSIIPDIHHGLLKGMVISNLNAAGDLPEYLSIKSSIGQDVLWAFWIPNDQLNDCLSNITAVIPEDIIREWTVNMVLIKLKQQQLVAVETGKVMEEKTGNVIYSTSTVMNDGEHYAVWITSPALKPDSMHAVSWLYVREGIKTKDYFDMAVLSPEIVDKGFLGYSLAHVVHQQQFGADLTFELYFNGNLPGIIELLILQKNASPNPRHGHDVKGLFQAESWHRYTQALQIEYKKQQQTQQLLQKESISKALAGNTFKLALNDNGVFREISADEGSVVYKINDRFYLVMNSKMHYALLDTDFPDKQLRFLFSKAEYFPSRQVLAMKGVQLTDGLVISLETGQITKQAFESFEVRNSHLYASTVNTTYIFDAKGLLNTIPFAEKVLFESPQGKYLAVKLNNKGEIIGPNKQFQTSDRLFFNQLGTVSDNGVVLGKPCIAMAQALGNSSLADKMHFIRMTNGTPTLVSKAECVDIVYLGDQMVACKDEKEMFHVYRLNGEKVLNTSFPQIEQILSRLQLNHFNKSDYALMKPASLQALPLIPPSGEETSSLGMSQQQVRAVFGPEKSRIWVLD
jgi:hypothetical protein